MIDPAIFEILSALLRAPGSTSDIPLSLQTDLLLRGAISTLAEDGSEQAIRILSDAALNKFIDSVPTLALDALSRLALEAKPGASSALFELFVEDACDAAGDIILKSAISAPSLKDEILFTLLSGQSQPLHKLDPTFEQASRLFLTSTNEQLRNRLLKAADRLGLRHWCITMQAVSDPVPIYMTALVGQFSFFLPAERVLAVNLIAEIAASGTAAACDALCLFYLRHDDESARKIALESGYLPQDPVDRALFLFLSEQWHAYENFDFDHRLLIAAYESANMSTRKRLLDLSRRSGQTEWFQSLSSGHRARWLNDLTDLDWEHAIARLQTGEHYEDLWRLAQRISPNWSARILSSLKDTGWQPPDVQEQIAFTDLANLARAAISSQLSIRAKQSFTLSGMEQFTCMAISPDGKYLAFGGATNAISIWRLTETPAQQVVLYGSVPQTRSLLFSPDGEYLITAAGDHSLRIYRWAETKVAKSLEGHSGLVRSLAISPDNRMLYTASFDGTIRSWRFPNGPAQKIIHQSSGEYFGITIGPNANTLAAAGADVDIHVFQLPEGRLLHTLTGHQATVTNLTAAQRSDIIASYSRDRSIRVWNALSARQLSAITNLPEVITAMCIHPGEDLLAAASLKGKITLYNVSTSLPLYEITAHRNAIIGLAVTPDGRNLISASVDGAVTMWNMEMYLLIRQPVETSSFQTTTAIETLLNASGAPQSEKNWLVFILELLHWRQRFDVQIEGPASISVGDFDIQLG